MLVCIFFAQNIKVPSIINNIVFLKMIERTYPGGEETLNTNLRGVFNEGGGLPKFLVTFS